ncbi:Methyltransferase domain-containing protein [Catalinimonas alkaloidigena]|uniref:Methyltransferase domain-containing protein n=1 Tax=Catalinimonas alkaloidigena TaxID=1075417 RepID=A0A1G9S9Y4_9BACT|nr:class I SAM-dependent methyltransferase [Catalinimonas alkaloidigena]SDM32127.1 Methyltransferase domain-containing protein [Catalinimonas alkaloidigena]
MDSSNGYEKVARAFVNVRGNATNRIGVPEVKSWAASFPAGATVLDLGCGSGMPISKTLIDQKLTVYGIDASPTLVAQFRKHFPHHEIRCESVEASSFYGLIFDGIVAWGLVFLLPPETQVALLAKIARHLKPGGKLLFTSPSQPVEWVDVMTGRPSASLGRETYRDVLAQHGIRVVGEFADEGENHYYSCEKA